MVKTGPCPSCHTKHARCYHRTFPTALGLGESPRQAAEDLLRRLNSEKDTVEDGWHFSKVEAAIGDLRSFLAESTADAHAPVHAG